MSLGSSRTLTDRRHTTNYWTRAQTRLVALLSLAAAQPAWAQTTNPNPPPIPPSSVVTSVPALSTVGAGGCKQQYTTAINGASQNALISQDAAVTSAGIAAAAAVTNATAQSIAGGTSTGAFTALSVGLAGTAAYGIPPSPISKEFPLAPTPLRLPGLWLCLRGQKPLLGAPKL